ncbi:hypothetical protein WA158_006159 [Blastocystis sp. Blastoise]
MSQITEDPKEEPYYYSYPFQQADPDTLPPDYCALASLLCGVISLFLNKELFAWISLSLCFGSISNLKFYEIDYTQCFVTIVFSIMSIVTAYLGGLEFAHKW